MASKTLTTQEQLQLRSVVSTAQAFITGKELVQSLSAITFEDLAAAQIDRLTGKGTGTRSNVVTRTKKVYSDLYALVGQMKGLDVESFPEADPSKDVNTPVLHCACSSYLLCYYCKHGESK